MKTPFRSFPATVLLALLPLGFLAVMVVAPLVAMAAYDGSAWSLVLADDYMQHRLVWTVVQAVGTCVLVLLLGIPVGWSLARLSFRGREVILRLLMLPFVMPTLVVGVGVLSRLSESFQTTSLINGVHPETFAKFLPPSTAETQTQIFGCFRLPQYLLILPKCPLNPPLIPDNQASGTPFRRQQAHLACWPLSTGSNTSPSDGFVHSL